MFSLNAVAGGFGDESRHLLDQPVTGFAALRTFKAQEGEGSVRGGDKRKSATVRQSFLLRDFHAVPRRATSAVDTTLENGEASVNFRSAWVAGKEAMPTRADSLPRALGDAGIEKTSDMPKREPLFPPLFGSLSTPEIRLSFISKLAWQSSCLQSLGISTDSFEARDPLTRTLAEVAIPEIANSASVATHETATVPPAGKDNADSSAPLPAPRQGNKFLRAVLTAAEALGRICDMVYLGINAAGRGCAHAYGFARDWCVGPGRKPVHPAAAEASTPSTPAGHVISTLDAVYSVTNVMDKFQGDGVTYDNVRYLIGTSWIRNSLDEVNRGLGATTKRGDSLLRALCTGANNVIRTFPRASEAQEFAPLFESEEHRQKYVDASRQYLLELVNRYPEFPEINERLIEFDKQVKHDDLDNLVDEARKAYAEKGEPFDENAYIADTVLLTVVRKDWNGKPVIDPQTGEPEQLQVTGRRLSEDMRVMRECLQQMAEYIKALKL